MNEPVARRSSTALVVALSIGGFHLTMSSGCAPSQGDGVEATHDAVATPVESDPAQTTMHRSNVQIDDLTSELGDLVWRRASLVSTLVEDPAAFTEADADAVARTIYDETIIAHTLAEVLRQDPSLIPRLCAAFERDLQEAELLEMNAWRALDRASRSLDPEVLAKILGEGAGDANDLTHANPEHVLRHRGYKMFLNEYGHDGPESIEGDVVLESASDIATLCLDRGESTERFDPTLH